MKILITGANGFVGKNLVVELQNQGYTDLFLCNRSTTLIELQKYTQEAEFVYHLAGVNRPKNEKEFESGNVEFTEKLLEFLASNPKPPKLMFSSSTQANLPNSYGRSKKNAESLVREYGYNNNVDVMIFQFPNLFGKWCKPNYNSVIATFCHNISRDIPIRIDDSNIELSLAYIDDVVSELIGLLDSTKVVIDKYYQVKPIYKKSLGEIVDLLTSFKESRINLSVANLDNSFEKKIYSTYLSYLPDNDFSYELKMHKDHRGSFTEFLRTPERGQVSINISKPGVKKENIGITRKTKSLSL